MANARCKALVGCRLVDWSAERAYPLHADTYTHRQIDIQTHRHRHHRHIDTHRCLDVPAEEARRYVSTVVGLLSDVLGLLAKHALSAGRGRVRGAGG